MKKYIFVVITHVVNVVAIVSKQKLKFIFLDGSRRSECSSEMKLHIFYSSPWRNERSCKRDLISFFELTMLVIVVLKRNFIFFCHGHGVVNVVSAGTKIYVFLSSSRCSKRSGSKDVIA